MSETPGRLGQLSREERAKLFEKIRQKKAAGSEGAAGGEAPLVRLSPEERDPSGLSLSSSQERIWLLDRLMPDTSTYNLAFAVRLLGPLDAEILTRCFAEVLRRHEVLRTTFTLRGDSPVQAVHPAVPFDLHRADLTGLPEERRPAESRHLADLWAVAPFDLERGPLLRVLLMRSSAEEHGLLLAMHHIITDGWSKNLLLGEVTALYAAFAEGRPSPLPELPVQYADFAAWQRERLRSAELQAQLAWWKERLTGAPEALDLPLDRARPAVQTFRGEALRTLLPPDLADRLRALARTEKGSLFMVLLAGLDLLLHRWSGQDDVLVGTPIAGRVRPQLESLIGFFLNTLVLRVDLSGGSTGRELVGRAREAALGAFARQEIPFEKLLEEVQPERDLSRTPLFQVFLNLLNFPDAKARLPGGLSLEVLADDWFDSKFDLTVYAVEVPAGLLLILVYNADLFEPARMVEMERQLRGVLEQLADAPDAPVEALSLLTPEALAVLPDPAAPLGDGWFGAVHALFAEQARQAPERAAVEGERGVWSYGELAEASARLAALLQRDGVGSQDPVAIWAERGAPLVWAVMGTLWAGGAFVILDPAYPPARLAETIRLAAPRYFLQVADAPPAEVEAVLAELSAERVLLGRVNLREQALGTLPAPIPPAPAGPDDLACIGFTSGSTGTPKGILGRHGPLSHFLPFQRERFGLGAAERVSLLSGLAHDPLQRDLFTPLCLGGTVCVPAPDDVAPGRLAAWMARQGVTLAHLTPAMAQLLAETGEGPAPSIPTLRRVLLVGDVLTRLDVERLRRIAPRVTCVNLYGSTETQRAVGHHVVEEREIADPRAPQVLPLGRGMRDVQLLIVRGGDEPRRAGVGEVGEIWVRSPHLARGYLNDEALTAERFRENPFLNLTGAESDRVYRTGDLGRYRPDGEVTFAGRADQQVKIRGFRIELGEIEAALGRLPGVREAIVLAREGRPDLGHGGRRLAAYVTGAGLERGALREALRARLPAYMVPADFVLLERLPVTPNGKVDRRALLRIDPAASEESAGIPYVAPRTDLEQGLAALWSEVLGRAQIGLLDDFFDLGGHSLAAARLVARLRVALDLDVPLRVLFEAPTLGGFAARCAGLAAPAAVEPPLVRLPPGGGLRLSVNQERLWFLDRLTPGTATYNLANRARLRGPLDIALLARCLAEIRRRHEVLRTRFEVRGGAAVQAVDPPAPWPLALLDLSALPPEACAAEAERLTAAEAQQPFDLAHGPLARALLLRLAPADHGLLLTLHHIVTDGWSMRILLRELTVLYEAFAAGAASPLPELPVQYADFAAWQRARLEGEEQERQIAWWRERLGTAPEPLDLPLDRPRPGVQSFRGASLHAHLPADLAVSLKTLARGGEASFFMVLLAGFDALLHRWSGQDDIVVGTPIAGRGRPELEDLIGFFLNTLVLRVDTAGRPGFRELIRRAREAALGAYAHSDAPFEKLLEELRPERDLSRTPLFQVFFNMLNLPDSGARLPDGLTVEPWSGAAEDAKFDLTVYLGEAEAGIDLHLLYNADLFDAARMEELLRQYRQLLERAAADPDLPLDAIPLVTPEAALRLPDPAAPLDDAWRGSVPDLFAAQAGRHPGRTALVDPEGEWTYGELMDAVERLAARLAVAGVGRGDRVAVWAHRSAPVAWAVLGTLHARAAFVMLDPAYPPARLLQMLDLAEPRAWLEIEAAGAPPAEVEAWLRDRAMAGTLLARLTLPGGGPAGARATLAGWPETAPDIDLGPDDLAYIAFTSGSTGAPKGILGRHGPLTHFLPWQHAHLDLREDDRYTLLSGLAHDPLQRDLVSSLCTGATLCAPPPEDLLAAGRLAAWAARERVTVAHLTPAMAQVLTEAPAGGERPAVPTLRRVLLVGDALTRLDVDRLRRLAPKVTCVNLYGSTETQRAVGFHVVEPAPAGGGRARQVLPLGRGMEDVQLLVLNPDGALAGIGEIGEICVRSPHLAAGYLGDPQLTAAKFVVNPFTAREGDRLYRTGDLGRYLPDGEVAFAGRADQQVKIRGFRIEPAEIEAALGRLPGVREAVVLAREGPGGAGDRGLAAYVVGENGPPPPAAELRAALAQRLPAYMVPAWIVPLERLPVTPNGKVDRRSLLRIDLRTDAAAPAGDAGFVEPRSDLERRITAVWCEVLGRERIGVRDNFFDLGGHSLLLVRLHARLQEELGRDLPLVDLFRHPNVEALATRLAGAPADGGTEEDAAELEGVVKDRASRQIEAARRQRELARGRRGK